jgi:membrane protein required for colicin V production
MVIDIIVLAVLLISALISFIRGFIRETLTILGVVGGLAAAYFGGPMLSPFIKDWLGVVEGEKPELLMGILPYPILADILSYGVIFILVVIILSIVSHILAETVRAIGLGAIDRTLGVLFGLARGLLVVAVLYLPFHLSADAETKARWFEGSKTHVWVEALAEQLAKLLPESAVEKIEEGARNVALEKEGEESLTVKPLDTLKGGQAPSQQQTPDSNTDGYSEQFRQQMDQMFQQDSAPSQPAPQPPAPQPQQQPPAGETP